MTWREPKDHKTDCYNCSVNIKGVGEKNRHKITYLTIPSAIRPILHSDELPVPVYIVLSPSERESIDEMPETDDVTQEMQTNCHDPSNDTSKSSASQ